MFAHVIDNETMARVTDVGSEVSPWICMGNPLVGCKRRRNVEADESSNNPYYTTIFGQLHCRHGDGCAEEDKNKDSICWKIVSI